MMYLPDGERYVVFASKAGADDNPDWFHNLKAHPDARIEVGDDEVQVRAVEVSGAERDRLYAQQGRAAPRLQGLRGQEVAGHPRGGAGAGRSLT